MAVKTDPQIGILAVTVDSMKEKKWSSWYFNAS